MAGERQELQIPIVFVGLDETPILFANLFAFQFERDAFVLVAGQLAPPLLLGSPEERLEQAKQISSIPVKVVGRFALSRDRVEELIDIMQRQLAIYDQRLEAGASDDELHS